MLVHNFILVECLGFEFKFYLNSIIFELDWKRKGNRKEKEIVKSNQPSWPVLAQLPARALFLFPPTGARPRPVGRAAQRAPLLPSQLNALPLALQPVSRAQPLIGGPRTLAALPHARAR